MIFGGCKQHLCIRVLRFNDLFGKLHVLIGIAGAVLPADRAFRHFTLQQISSHRLRFRHALIRALSAGRNQNGFLSGLFQLFSPEIQGGVTPCPQQRCQRTIPPEPASENDNIVLIHFRLMKGCPDSAYHGTQQHALTVGVHCTVQIIDRFMHPHGLDAS